MAASVDVGLKFVAFAACNAIYDNTNIYTIMCPMHAGHVMFIFHLQIDGGTLAKRKKTSGVNRWATCARMHKYTLMLSMVYLFM